MKIAKISLPLCIVALIGMFLAVHYNDFELPPEGSGYAGVLVFFAYLFLMMWTFLPLIIFIPFGIALFICELCLFLAQGKLAALTAALVLSCLLLPVVLMMAVYFVTALSEFAVLSTVVVAMCAALYLGAFIAVCVGHAKEKKARS